MTKVILLWENFPQKVSSEMELKGKKKSISKTIQKLRKNAPNQLCPELSVIIEMLYIYTVCYGSHQLHMAIENLMFFN